VARPPKSLLELIEADTFRRDRHRALVIRETLPAEPPEWASPGVWRKLRFAQATYRKYSKAKSAHARGMAFDYLDAFSRCVRALHGGRLPWLLGDD
jgi:hypothetical protein